MTEFRPVTDTFSVAPQIEPGDVARAAAEGYVLVINNRPEGEAPDQTPGPEIERLALEAGLAYLAIPIMGGPRPDQGREMVEAIEDAGGRVLAYCRSGTRSINTWALGQALTGQIKPTDLVHLGQQAGYDLRSLLLG